METKKSNILYTSFLCTVIPIFLIFFIVPIVSASNANKSYTVDYNTTLELGNDYLIKITDAAFLEDNNELNFMVSIKGKKEVVTASYPEITEILIVYNDGKSVDKVSEYKSTELNELSQIISVANVLEDIKYVEVIAESTEADYYDSDIVDEFGDIIQGEKHDGEIFGQRVVIDRNDIEYLKSSEYNPKAKEDITNEPLDSESSDVRPETTTIKTNVAKTVSLNSNNADEPNDDEKNMVSETKKSTTKVSDNNNPQDSNEVINVDTYANNETSNAQTSYINNYTDNHSTTTQSKLSTSGTDKRTTSKVIRTTTTKQTTTRSTTSKSTTKQNVRTSTTTTVKKVTTTTSKSVIHVTGIKLDTGFDDNNVRISIGESHKISAIITPINAADKSVTWKSNRTDIATIDSLGNISAVGTGKAIITATSSDGSLTASCMVTVE